MAKRALRPLVTPADDCRVKRMRADGLRYDAASDIILKNTCKKRAAGADLQSHAYSRIEVDYIQEYSLKYHYVSFA